MKAKISKTHALLTFVAIATILMATGVTDWKGGLLIMWTPVGLYFLLCQYIYRISKPIKPAIDNDIEIFFSQMTKKKKDALLSVIIELDKAETKHPEWPKDLIYAAAIVNEESGELIRAALNHHYESNAVNSGSKPRYDHNTLAEMKNEAAQTAAMGLRFLINLEN